MKKFTILMGKSASGKDYLYKYLLKKYNFTKLTSVTDRPMRESEVQDREYHFVSKEEMQKLIRDLSFVEYRQYHTLVNGVEDVWTYGVLKDDYISNDKNYLLILDLTGTESFIKEYGIENCEIFYIFCEDKEREQRAKNRGSFDEQEWNRRKADDDKKLNEDLIFSKIKDVNFVDNTFNDNKATFIIDTLLSE